MSRKIRIIFFFALFQIPVLLLFSGILDYSVRYWVLAVASSILILYTLIRKYSFSDLGFRNINLKKDILYNTAFCIFAVAALITAFSKGWIRDPTIPEWDYFFVFYVFISSPLQEFLFRPLVFHELKLAGCGKSGMIVISAINFGMMHVFYHDMITFLAALFIGLVFGLIYSQTKSIYGISVSHAVAGAISIYVGLI